MLKDFLEGCYHFFKGIELILKPGIKRYVLMPLIINILTFILMFVVAEHYILVFNHWFEQFLPTWLFWLKYVLWLLFSLSFFIVGIYLFTLFGNIIAAPFNSSLSTAVRLYLTKEKVQDESLFATVKDTPRIISRSFSIIFYYIPRVIALFILFFVPILQLLAPIAWFVFHAQFMSLVYLDYPTDNQRVSLAEVHQFIRANRLLILGFGTMTLIASCVPFVNFTIIPIATAGATHLWIARGLRSLGATNLSKKDQLLQSP